MRNLRLSSIILLLAICCVSCLDLSGLLYNPEQISEYQYDNYNDGIDNIDPMYDIVAGELTEFTTKSVLGSEEATIYGVYLGDMADIATDTIILYCHGNASHMDIYFQRVKMLYNANGKSNYSIVMFDYRGFGRSTSTPSEEGLKVDTKAVIEWLKTNGMGDDQLIVYGFSLGSIPAVSTCVEDSGVIPIKLMLEAPIGSIDAMAEDGSGLSLSSSFFADLETNNIEDIEQVDQPLYWLHGEDDDFLALLTQGLPIFDNHDGAFKVAEIVAKGNHGNTPFIMGVEEYITSVSSFIRQKE